MPINDHNKPVTSEEGEDATAAPPTKQQKLIKAGLLLGLVLVIVYVILDYTVSHAELTSRVNAADGTRDQKLRVL